MRATALNLPAIHCDRRRVIMGLGEPTVGVSDPFGGQALEERVEVFVVAADAPCLETGRQEDGVDPVRLLIAQHGANQLRCYREPVTNLLIRNAFPYSTFRKVQDDGFGTEYEFDGIADAVADLITLRHDRLEQCAKLL